MPRIALGVEYDGSHYCGWQRQRHSDSVQARVESALSKIANEPITIHCAGRTDTGVHATGQVAHFDTNVSRTAGGWVLGCNAKMPASVSLRWASEVDDEFHARFSALERRYRYLIFNSRARSALYAQRACVVHAPLDEALMSAAAQQLLGEHDFSAFRAAGCQAKHPRRDIRQLRVSRAGPYVIIDIAANAFLQHMVRNIAGLLISIGVGDKSVDWAGEILRGKDRTRSAASASANGLYLTQVIYPEQHKLPTPDSTKEPLLGIYPFF